MVELIRTYAPNSDEMVKLKLACYELEQLSRHGTRYTVEDIYFDLGQNWMYSAIVANSVSGSSWQALCPRDYERVLLSTDIRKTCEDIVSDKYWYDP